MHEDHLSVQSPYAEARGSGAVVDPGWSGHLWLLVPWLKKAVDPQ